MSVMFTIGEASAFGSLLPTLFDLSSKIFLAGSGKAVRPRSRRQATEWEGGAGRGVVHVGDAFIVVSFILRGSAQNES